MSKAVNTDHKFNIDTYAELLSKAQGGRSQTEFAKNCGLSVAYICKHLNKRISTPPIPSTLKKIAAVAANGISYEDLLDAAGYDASKYTTKTSIVTSDEWLNATNHIQFEKLGIATITGELSHHNLKWSLNGKTDTSIKSYDLDVELSGNKLTHWYFNFLTSEPKAVIDENSAFLNRIYAYYGHLVMMPAGITTKYSFVTDSEIVYDSLKSHAPTALAMYVSIILIDTTYLSVIKEEYVKTAFSDNVENIFSFLTSS